MELKELTEKTLDLFNVKNPQELGKAVMDACDNPDQLRAFKELVDRDLTQDWMQKIYQYYLADRKDKKQDYTPPTIAEFMGRLAGNSDRIVDMCAGSGALIIQKWIKHPYYQYTAIEYDANVIPFLIFNMVLRNIKCKVYHMNALTDDEPIGTWDIVKGEEFGHIVNIKPAV